jgi:N6-L-threonylcarbamoyladenine synthase
MHVDAVYPAISKALSDAGCTLEDLDCVAVTYGPGLVGALLVGLSAAKGLCEVTGLPLVGVHHLKGHIAANYLCFPELEPPFLCLCVSGGNTMIVRVDTYTDMQILGRTRDDAAGEAIDKIARVIGLGYPGGPKMDKAGQGGDTSRYQFSRTHMGDTLDFSFSGIKTSLLYFTRDELAKDPDFIQKNKEDLCASFQKALIDILMDKLIKAARQTGIRQVTIGGGVSANSALRARIVEEGKKRGWTTYLPEFKFTTDNAAMIAIVGQHKYQDHDFCSFDAPSFARVTDKF